MTNNDMQIITKFCTDEEINDPSLSYSDLYSTAEERMFEEAAWRDHMDKAGELPHQQMD